MKSFLAVLFVTVFTSAPVLANAWYYDDVSRTAAPTSDQSIAANQQNPQEFTDRASIGQAAPMRMQEYEVRCKDFTGKWLYKEDVGYSACVRDSKLIK